MELKIKQIHNAGDIRREFIELYVNSPTNLKNFIISDSLYTQFQKDCKKFAFWFPDLQVNQGISIMLNTRKGINNFAKNTFYWNSNKALWKDKPVSTYLIKIDNFDKFPDSRRYLDSLFSSD